MKIDIREINEFLQDHLGLSFLLIKAIMSTRPSKLKRKLRTVTDSRNNQVDQILTPSLLAIRKLIKDKVEVR